MNGVSQARRGFVASALACIVAPFTFFRRAPEPKRMYFVGDPRRYRWPDGLTATRRREDTILIVDGGTESGAIHGVSRSPK